MYTYASLNTYPKGCQWDSGNSQTQILLKIVICIGTCKEVVKITEYIMFPIILRQGSRRGGGGEEKAFPPSNPLKSMCDISLANTPIRLGNGIAKSFRLSFEILEIIVIGINFNHWPGFRCPSSDNLM